MNEKIVLNLPIRQWAIRGLASIQSRRACSAKSRVAHVSRSSVSTKSFSSSLKQNSYLSDLVIAFVIFLLILIQFKTYLFTQCTIYTFCLEFCFTNSVSSLFASKFLGIRLPIRFLQLQIREIETNREKKVTLRKFSNFCYL